MSECLKCGEFFQPTPEEERLMASKQIEEICMACAIAESEKDADGQLPPPILGPLVPQEKTDGTKLYRVEWFDHDGRLVSFVAIPPKPLIPRFRGRVHPKKRRLRVMTMGKDHGARMLTEPRVTLHTNLDNYEKLHQPFWARKIPDYWDPFTGVGSIEIPADEIMQIDREKQKTVVLLKNGGQVRLLYK